MAVEVVTSRSQGIDKKATHENGDGILVHDGHLNVTQWDGSTHTVIAIYAPGQWITTKVVKDKKP